MRPSAFGPPRASAPPPRASAPPPRGAATDAAPARVEDEEPKAPEADAAQQPAHEARAPTNEAATPPIDADATHANEAGAQAIDADATHADEAGAQAIDADATHADEARAQAIDAGATHADEAGAQAIDADATHAPASPEPRVQLPPPRFAPALGSLRPHRREGFSARARRPLLSVALFGGIAALSVVALLRDAEPSSRATARAGASEHSQPGAAPRATHGAGALAPPVRAAEQARDRAAAEPAAPLDPAQQLAGEILALRLRGERALLRRNTREAEELFTRILALEEGNARAAHGIARVRLAQGNLGDAERWIRLAISKRPRRAAYHAFYAELLTELGREDEALEERLRAAGGMQRD